jgi:hypothetical protein
MKVIFAPNTIYLRLTVIDPVIVVQSQYDLAQMWDKLIQFHLVLARVVAIPASFEVRKLGHPSRWIPNHSHPTLCLHSHPGLTTLETVITSHVASSNSTR